MSLQKWKELAEERRLVEQYYKEKDKVLMRGWQNQSQKR